MVRKHIQAHDEWLTKGMQQRATRMYWILINEPSGMLQQRLWNQAVAQHHGGYTAISNTARDGLKEWDLPWDTAIQ
ncbi:hypothetical protein A0H81_05057 [Grifola frondosa]|uniref:Uncharacterized protein n=1 Tax=Grifola frondosa TaxID=5627 RepID=A0A1C7ME43_GRIFR|nr:hypothetical protein A0H81_05057 [Grifola frondosa]